MSTTRDRDDNGRFTEGNVPKNAFADGTRPENQCTECGFMMAKINENGDIARYECGRCGLTWTKLRRKRL